MAVSRRYDDPCGVARALDVVGDRWALLVVRELIYGPRRFVHLVSGLGGISPNVLSQRLRDLEQAGLLCRELLDPPASVAVYELTWRGQALKPVLLELGRWGRLQPVTTPAKLSVSALLVALETVFVPDAAGDAGYGLRVNSEWYQMSVAGGSMAITQGRPERPAVTLETDAATLRSVAFGRESMAAAERDGRLTVSGDRAAAERFPAMFSVPRVAD